MRSGHRGALGAILVAGTAAVLVAWLLGVGPDRNAGSAARVAHSAGLLPSVVPGPPQWQGSSR